MVVEKMEKQYRETSERQDKSLLRHTHLVYNNCCNKLDTILSALCK